MSLEAKHRQLVSRFQIIEDSHERLAAIMAAGRKWAAAHEAERAESNRVQGCASRVWLEGSVEAGGCRFRIAADSPLVLGLSALLCELYDGAIPAEICAFEPSLWEELALDRQLSPTRLHGLASVRRAIVEIAHTAPPR